MIQTLMGLTQQPSKLIMVEALLIILVQTVTLVKEILTVTLMSMEETQEQFKEDFKILCLGLSLL